MHNNGSFPPNSFCTPCCTWGSQCHITTGKDLGDRHAAGAANGHTSEGSELEHWWPGRSGWRSKDLESNFPNFGPKSGHVFVGGKSMMSMLKWIVILYHIVLATLYDSLGIKISKKHCYCNDMCRQYHFWNKKIYQYPSNPLFYCPRPSIGGRAAVMRVLSIARDIALYRPMAVLLQEVIGPSLKSLGGI